jgi:hypothetical protein
MMLFADCNGMSAAFQLSVPEAVPLRPVLVDHVIRSTPTSSDAHPLTVTAASVVEYEFDETGLVMEIVGAVSSTIAPAVVQTS